MMISYFSSVIISLYKLFFQGSLEKGGSWGGQSCYDTLSWSTRSFESIYWTIFLIFIFLFFNFFQTFRKLIVQAQNFDIKPTGPKSLIFQRMFHFQLEPIINNTFLFLNTFHLLLLLYYKWRSSSMINLLQPCHLTLILQTIALKSKGPTGIIIGVLLLPMSLGPIMAIVVPATDGLNDYFEKEAFFLLHYTIQLVPIHLLTRNRFASYQLSCNKYFFLGNWINCAVNWWVGEMINNTFKVNLNFMLCPTDAMASNFARLPNFLLYPSYRTLITVAFCTVNILICWAYILIAFCIFRIVNKSYLSNSEIKAS